MKPLRFEALNSLMKFFEVAVWAPLSGVEFWVADRAISHGLHCAAPARGC